MENWFTIEGPLAAVVYGDPAFIGLTYLRLCCLLGSQVDDSSFELVNCKCNCNFVGLLMFANHRVYF